MIESETISYSLSNENLKNIPFNKYEKDFTFVVNGKRYQTNRFVADILSPYLRNCHFVDSTINEFNLNTQISKEKEQDKEDCFNDLLNLVTSQNTQIDFKHQKYFAQYFYLLGNYDEYLRVQSKYPQNYTAENVIDIFLSIYEMSPVIPKQFNLKTNPIREILTFIASHFEEIKKEDLKKLDVGIFDEIFRSESLLLRDEDSLLQFILSLYEKDPTYSALFEYVHFTNVSDNSLQLFIKLFEVDDINKPIWKSICNRLLQNKKQNSAESINNNNERNIQNFKRSQIINMNHQDAKEITVINPNILQSTLNDKNNMKIHNESENSNDSNQNIKTFLHHEGKEFDGIMKYLTKETGGNIHDNKTIEITSNSINSDNITNHPKNLVDYEDSNLYCSKDAGGAIICFDFKDKLVQLTNYSIKSYRCGENWSHLRNWVIEVSNNGEYWEEIDFHEDDKSLNGDSIVATFDITKPNNFHRFIRLRQTGYSWNKHSSNHTLIVFPFIEFYGKLKIQ